jgi:HSP20 family protein
MPSDDVEINQTKDGAYLVFDVPGYNKSNLNVEAENGILSIKGERISKIDGKESKKTISKQYQIGSDCDVASIEATIDDGLLTVFIPNFKKPSKKTIKIS